MAGKEIVIDDGGIPVCGGERIDLTKVDGKENKYICPAFKLSERGWPLCIRQSGRICPINKESVVIYSQEEFV